MPDTAPTQVRRTWASKFFGNVFFALLFFLFGTVFTPEVQPYIYRVKDIALGCTAPMERAQDLLTRAETQSDKPLQDVSGIFRAAYTEFEKASQCNTPNSARALIAMATLHCMELGVERDLRKAHNLIHQANTIPGGSIARAYTAIANCGVLSHEN